MSDVKDLKKYVQGIIVLLAVLVVIQGIQLYYTKYPVAQPVVQGATPEQVKIAKENKALLEKVAKLTDINSDEQALILTIDDVEAVRKADPLNEQVYKDAQNGDRIIRFSDRMIIFNEGENKIVYEGKSPVQMQQEQLTADLQSVLSEVSQLTTINPQARPQLLTVAKPEELKKQNPEVYKDVELGDRVLLYTDRVIIYRPTEKKIVFDAKLRVQQ